MSRITTHLLRRRSHSSRQYYVGDSKFETFHHSRVVVQDRSEYCSITRDVSCPCFIHVKAIDGPISCHFDQCIAIVGAELVDHDPDTRYLANRAPLDDPTYHFRSQMHVGWNAEAQSAVATSVRYSADRTRFALLLQASYL